jgi:RES domain-containing protein
VEVYRLTRRKFAGKNPFDGEGSFLFGGRWSSIGTRLCYAATHRSLAILEYRVHVELALMPDDLVIATLEIPDEVAITPTPALPENWKEYPAPYPFSAGAAREQRHAKSITPGCRENDPAQAASALPLRSQAPVTTMSQRIEIHILLHRHALERLLVE